MALDNQIVEQAQSAGGINVQKPISESQPFPPPIAGGAPEISTLTASAPVVQETTRPSIFSPRPGGLAERLTQSQTPTTPENIPSSPEASNLRKTYTDHAARRQQLVHMQFGENHTLTKEEKDERDELDRMADNGLLNPDLPEARLKVLSDAYEAMVRLEKEVLSDPVAARERYNALGRKLTAQGLKENELKEFNRLDKHHEQGKF